MEQFYLEEPNISRKGAAISYINEFYAYGSELDGTGGLQKYLTDYGGWLRKLEKDHARIPDEERVPARTYFLIRKHDDRIVGMINIRLTLNESLRKFGGHIGYSIRPTERGKGYSKVNLYLGLKVCQVYGIDKARMDADQENPASWRTMEALGGICTSVFFEDENAHCVVKAYEINVDESISSHAAIYEPMIEREMPRT